MYVYYMFVYVTMGFMLSAIVRKGLSDDCIKHET